VLVLDDYHVITDRSVHETVTLLVERMPEHVHVVVATRDNPPLPLGRLRAAGELQELRTDDLAFDTDEVTRVLTGVPGVDLGADEVDRLARRTEGWPAGVALAAASLAGRDGDVSAIDPGRRWFRFHRLFGELLRQELALAEPTVVPTLHRRAAAWSTGTGAIGDAVAHHVAAGDLDQAAELIAGCWTDRFNADRLSSVAGWLDLLPDPHVRADPRLCVARAWLLLDMGRLDEVGRWIACGEAAGGGDLTAQRDLAVLRATHRFKIGDLGATRAAARRVLELDDGAPSFAATVAHLQLGITAFWSGDVPGATRPRWPPPTRAISTTPPARATRPGALHRPRRRRAFRGGSATPRPCDVARRLGPASRAGSAPATGGAAGIILCERERELLPLLASTLSQREIGTVLHLSLNTVKTHGRLLFRKLGVSSRAEAVARARELGLLS
jgi:ATP/maltotriose-dependent transcriptional regulator MalT